MLIYINMLSVYRIVFCCYQELFYLYKCYRIGCTVRTPSPKFGHLPVKWNSKFLHGRNKLTKIVIRMLVLKLASEFILFITCLQHLQTMCVIMEYWIFRAGCPNLGHTTLVYKEWFDYSHANRIISFWKEKNSTL